MSAFPGPPALGRGVITLAGRPVPSECDPWPKVVIDDAALAAPTATAAVLHDLWLRRRPCVVLLDCAPADLRRPERCERRVWEVGEGFEFGRERLQYLAWSNNYDFRDGDPVWWHSRRALRLGAMEGSHTDVVLPDGRPAWCDGGPREPLPLVAIHRGAIEAGSLQPDRTAAVQAPLAPDQLAAVAHGGGAARIIAPAGSGKTRVLTERLRHLLADRGVTPSSVTAVAFNKRAADELEERTSGLPAHIRTLNSLGLALVNGSGPFARAGPPRRVIEEVEVRRILESLVSVRRQQNTDPWAPYLDALSMIRLGLVSPEAAEEAIPDATGVAQIFDAYRAALAERDVVDFDEQIYLAIEVLLGDDDARRHDQRATRHLLVDEFQDLTPAHLLLIRLLSAPTYDVFGVGDDDQVIYSYAGATPEFLIGYGKYFPGAAEYALQTNYRCPPAIVEGARTLLGHNRRRVAKSIEPRQGREHDAGALRVDLQPSEQHAGATADHIRRWLAGGAAPADIAVLARVNSVLLPVQVTLSEQGIACTAPVGTAILTRTGIRAALAYLRIGSDPEHISRRDVAETIRRPSRRIARNVTEMLQKRAMTSIADIRRLAGVLTGSDVERLLWYAEDLEAVARAVSGGTTAKALQAIRVDVGLGSAMDVLDGSKGNVDRSTHLDDLAALEQVAVLHPEPATFESWLTEVVGRPGESDGVSLSTIHRVKGREWPHVLVYGASDGLFPHRLAGDVEEERRVFHVAVTRASVDAVVLADAAGPSPFCRELSTAAPVMAARPVVTPRDVAARREAPPASEALSALRAWRTETASRDKVPAYIVFSDAHLEGIAADNPSTLRELARCKGIGPAKLERYGDDILAVLDEAGSPRKPLRPKDSPRNAATSRDQR